MTWTAPSLERRDPASVAAERDSLEQWLDYERETLLCKCAGLSAEQLKLRAVPPSALSLLGLVRHMTEVERWWFRMVAAGEEIAFVYCADGSDDADFDKVEEADAAGDLDRFLSEIKAARAAVAGKALDDVVATPGRQPERTRDIRWIYVHMIEEYARHNGHADLLRECIDGTVGD
jgi:uncharacterized damage-inducible protein DinB